MLAQDVLHHLLHRGLVGGVGRPRVGCKSPGAQLGGALLDDVTAPPKQNHGGAQFAQRRGHAQAQMGAAARHQSDAASQVQPVGQGAH